MKKAIFATILLSAAVSLSPAYAQTMTCSEADMAKTQASIDKMTDMAKKEMAMKEMAMAKEKMTAKDDKGCMDHMKMMEPMMPKM